MDETSVTRRWILGLAGGMTATLTGGAYLLSSDPRPDRNDAGDDGPPDVDGEPVTSMAERVGAESITDHGAEPNPDDPSAAAAKRNLDAIHAAADAAGENGAIYVPSGTYHIGHDGTGVGRLVLFTGTDRREPAGISVYGDGPTESTLAVTEHMPDDQNHNALIYDEGGGHGQVMIRDLTLDGNYENLGNLWGENRSSRGIVVRGSNENATFDLYNVRFRGWYTQGLWLNDAAGTAKYCAWEESGIGVFNDGSVGHHVACSPVAGNEFKFECCQFKNCSGNAINIVNGRGTTLFERCRGEGLGTGVHKITAGELIRHEHCYWQPHNQWIDERLRRGETPERIGWNMFHRSVSRDGPDPTLELYDVEVRNTNAETFLTWREGPLIRGDRIAVHNGSYAADGTGVFREGNDGRLRFEIDRLSVHGSDEVFNLDRAEGRIEQLRRAGSWSLGDTGNLAIGTEDPDAEPFSPDVPSRSTVGILTPSGRNVE